MEYLLWESLILGFGILFIYMSIKTWRQSDEEYIDSLKQRARETARSKGVPEDAMIQKLVGDKEENAHFWRMQGVTRGIGVGIVALVAFIALVLYDWRMGFSKQ
jgi:hypothetical protein